MGVRDLPLPKTRETHREVSMSKERARGGNGLRGPGRPVLRGNGGFTLTELMIAAGLSIAVIAAVVVAYSGTVRSWQTTAAYANIQREASLAIEVMSRSIRPGSNVVIGAGGDSLAVVLNTGSTDSTIALFTLNDDGSIVDINGGVVTTRVDSLGFSSADQKSVNIDLVLRDDIGTAQRVTDDQSVYMSTTAICRN
jgi:Tfp pilus assembly protein PilW